MSVNISVMGDRLASIGVGSDDVAGTATLFLVLELKFF